MSFLLHRTICSLNRIPLRLRLSKRFSSNDVRYLIGDREVVGHGKNGQYTYIDDDLFPFPAIRFRRPTEDIIALRMKEQGDWRLLSLEEKKTLYRYSFCSTFVEINAPTGEWMRIVGVGLMFISLGIWLYIILTWKFAPPRPITFLPEYVEAQLQRMIDIEVNPITGLASKWDYDKGCWKK